MGATGSFTFVLHSHLPYLRHTKSWPYGEERLLEALSDTYIPLLRMLYDLRDEGIAYKLTLGLSPVLAEQLAEPMVLDNFDHYLLDRIAAAENDSTIFEKLADEPGNTHLAYLASWYRGWYQAIKDAFNTRFERDLIGAFRRLQDEGYIEIITTAATHSYLPLLKQPGSIRGQIATGIASYKRLFGKPPTALWLPESGYRPGIESFLVEQNIRVFFTESHAITGGQPVGVAAGDVIGPYGSIKRHYVIPAAPTQPKRDTTTFKPYYVTQNLRSTTVIGRNNRTGQQVWSADWGYPGDFDYREIGKKAGTSGLRYWRVTGAKTDLTHKDYYHPEWAAYKVDQHAEHFAHLVGDQLREYFNETGEHGLIASNYNTDLFGQWWFEGIEWLGKVLRHLADNAEVELTTASDFVDQHPAQAILDLPESSWGAGGSHFAWNNGENAWMWTMIHDAESRMARTVQHYNSPSDDETIVLQQAARELLLLQSSDWPFWITSGSSRDYAIQRFIQHVESFTVLLDSLDADQPDADEARRLYKRDNIFPTIDYQLFG